MTMIEERVRFLANSLEMHQLCINLELHRGCVMTLEAVGNASSCTSGWQLVARWAEG